ncbi:hypothetical protein FQN54_002613 [Arachnomyces sp. PD_36]|nr:hypothetical protein FQN54_002613 [Arachnomyces sp. PD_36]
MSGPSTPRSARDLSPATNDGSPEILTPRRKIQALLAGFGSDSESEKDTNASRKAAPSLNITSSKPHEQDAEQPDDADEDDLPRPPKGRLAARMQAQNSENEQSGSEEDTAFDRVKRRFNTRKEEEQSTRVASATLSSSEDDAPVTTGKRRLLKHKQNDSIEAQSGSDRARSESPLFCSPYKPQEKQPDPTPTTRDSDDEDEDEEIEQPKNARFLALVEKKRKEREAKEKEEEAKKKRRAEIAKTIASDEISDGSDDDLAGRKLTQSSKPTRKASKKALQAMNQETQRMSRNMQLEHQARTKKKITKESFFSRFNFGQQGSSSTVGSSNPPSAAESEKEHATPPTSPPRSPNEDNTKTTATEPQLPELPPVAEENSDSEGENVMSIEEILSNPNPPSEPQETHEKPQARATTPATAPRASRKGPIRLRVSRESVAENQKDNSDSDLEVVTSPGKCRRIAAFENLPVRKAQDSDSMLRLRALAHLYSPTKRRQSKMTASEMQMSLRKQARLQAMKEREEKIQELKDKGIYVDTAEERARVEEDVEDLMEKARMEGEEISKREKEAAKKEGKSEPNAFDDEDDEDYDGGEEEEDLSGSDEEDEEDEDEDGAGEEAKSQGEDGFVEDQADVAEESDDPIEDSEIEEDQVVAHTSTGRRKRGVRVISDDEDEEREPTTEQKAISQPQSAKKPQIPNLNTTEEPSLGLTQAFAATLGDSQGDIEQDSLAALRNMPDPSLINSAMLVPDSQEIVKDSQERPSEPIDLFAGYTQSDSRVSETPSKAQMFTQTQYSEVPEPTQDAGFVLSPFDQRNRFRDAPPSTEETVLLQNNDSPIAKRKGKLLRRRGPVEAAAQDEDDGFTIKASAFDVLRKKAKKVPQVFDKTKSNAREVVDEAAEESEDEYAGLGGASDDGADEEDEYDQSMINDNSGEKVDEKELAALNANHVREQDEKQVSKLLKDITTGALRRKRGAADDLDLSDSDDERLAARRRAKRREFNKMRKALLEDEKIGQIAENPKKLAFLRAIEDREPDDDIEIDFLQEGSGSQEEEGSKDESASQDAQAASGEESGGKNKRKRPLNPSAADTTNRPPPNKRRTVASKKPATLAEIRESLSFLLEGPDTGRPEPVLDDESDAEDENAQRPRADYFNRTTVSRTPSADSAKPSSLTNMVGPSSKMAFQANRSTPDDSKPFSLIRHIAANSAVNISRANSSSSSSSSSTSSGFAAMRTVGRGGNGGEKKRGAVNYYTAAREKEREREMKRREQGGGSRSIKSLLAAGQRGGGAGLGALGGGGKWE